MFYNAERSVILQHEPGLSFEISPIFDLILSLFVISDPNLEPKPSWARSVKGKLSSQAKSSLRFFFESEEHIGLNTLSLTLRLPPPRRIEDFFSLLEALPSVDFFSLLVSNLEPFTPNLANVIEKSALKQGFEPEEKKVWDDFAGRYSPASIKRLENLRLQPGRKEDLRLLLVEYWESFFHREFYRHQEQLLQSAKSLLTASHRLSPQELLTKVGGGLLFPPGAKKKKISFAPAIFATPFVFSQESAEELLLIYPARSKDEREKEELRVLLLRALKALADPTRLEIVRLLSQREMYALEISRALELSHPTVLHHMASLRIAGVVETEFRAGNNYYALKKERLSTIYRAMSRYLTK